MERAFRKYLAKIGGRGGKNRSEAKVRAARKNGSRGGRPRKLRELSAFQAMQEVASGADWRTSFMNFADGFRRSPSLSLVREDPSSICPNVKLYALLQSICLQLCLENGLSPKDWLLKRAFLDEPWFVAEVKSLFGLSSSDDVLAIMERYYPEKQVPLRMKFFVEELFAEPTFVEQAAKTPIRWRPCPAGQHWRKAHFQPMYKTKTGKVVRGHKVSEGCCDNPSKKDQIYEEELKLIAKKFVGLSGAPTANELGFVGKGNRYDELIRGWTRFWNDTLKPEDPLDPNLVKALIASESGFDRDPKRGSRIAKGLMQITNGTRKSLGGFKDELKDHLVHVDQKNILDPTLNIAAGTRWLFQKKYLAGRHLKRMATWDEAVAEYKRYLQDIVKDPTKTPAGMKVFRDFYRTLGGK